MGLSPAREATSCVATQELPQHFMKPEGSLPCSQQPSSGPYPEPDQSSSYHPIVCQKYILILYTHLHLGLPSVLSPTNILHAFLFSPICATCPAYLIIFLSF
jgi:hypothetical protein